VLLVSFLVGAFSGNLLSKIAVGIPLLFVFYIFFIRKRHLLLKIKPAEIIIESRESFFKKIKTTNFLISDLKKIHIYGVRSRGKGSDPKYFVDLISKDNTQKIYFFNRDKRNKLLNALLEVFPSCKIKTSFQGFPTHENSYEKLREYNLIEFGIELPNNRSHIWFDGTKVTHKSSF
ncbi:MAG: hypothetical protein IAF38_10140, partial [Bacteroidia bacterium]|nr:hypothetical protein [Bacteroidia bacterium]